MGIPYRGGPAAGLDSPREVNIVSKQKKQNKNKQNFLYITVDIHEVTDISTTLNLITTI